MLFNSLWSILVLVYIGIAPIYFPRYFHPLFSLILQGLTNLFWFAGSIALASAFGGPYDCGADSACGTTTAAIIFGFFLWIIFCVLNFLDFRESRRGGSEGQRHSQPMSEGSV